jgi:hypothetical protein
VTNLWINGNMTCRCVVAETVAAMVTVPADSAVVLSEISFASFTAKG